MSTATGNVHWAHPILASFIGDYPEQVLTACMLTGNCPRCSTSTANLGNFDLDNVPSPRSLGEFLDVLASFRRDPAGFLQASSWIRAKPVPHPFWLNLPQFDIFRSITPDVLHQLYLVMGKSGSELQSKPKPNGTEHYFRVRVWVLT
jgi:hypothetical protein